VPAPDPLSSSEMTRPVKVSPVGRPSADLDWPYFFPDHG